MTIFIFIVGNTDGIYKGRRYFSCPPLNGKMVRITNVLAVLSNKVCIIMIALSDKPILIIIIDSFPMYTSTHSSLPSFLSHPLSYPSLTLSHSPSPLSHPLPYYTLFSLL